MDDGLGGSTRVLPDIRLRCVSKGGRFGKRNTQPGSTGGDTMATYAYDAEAEMQDRLAARKWKEHNTDTDRYEDAVLELSRQQYESSVRVEQERERAFFDSVRGTAHVGQSEDDAYLDQLTFEADQPKEDVWDEYYYGDSPEPSPQPHNAYNNGHVQTDQHTPTTVTNIAPPGLVDTRTKEADEMNTHLRIVRERLRLKRLQREHENLQLNSNMEVKALLQHELHQQKRVVLEMNHAPSSTAVQGEVVGGGLEAAFPPRQTGGLREEVLRRRPDLWQQQPIDTFSVHNVPRTSNVVTNEEFGGSLGECLVRREIPVRRSALESSAPQPQIRRRGRQRATAADFGGDLGSVLRQSTTAPTEIARHGSNTDNVGIIRDHAPHRTASSLQRQRQEAAMSDWGGQSLDQIVQSGAPCDSRDHRRQRDQAQPPPQPNFSDASSTAGVARGRQEAAMGEWGGQSLDQIIPPRAPRDSRNHQRERERERARPPRQPNFSDASSTAGVARGRQEAAMGEWGGQSLDQIIPPRAPRDSRNHQRQRERERARPNNRDTSSTEGVAGGRSDFMAESEMTYERLLALDDAIPNRNLAVAAKKGKSGKDLYKSLRNGFYRTKKNGEAEDECAICLSAFEHHTPIKKFPCDHTFHSECAKELLNFNTKCPLCRYDLVTKGY